MVFLLKNKSYEGHYVVSLLFWTNMWRCLQIIQTQEAVEILFRQIEAAKVTYQNTTEYDLTVAGSTWFKTSSTATNGGDKAFPSGTYRSVVQAECIAK